MKRSLAVLALAASFALAGCSSAAPEAAPTSTTPPVQSAPAVEAPAAVTTTGPASMSPQELIDSLSVDVREAKTFTHTDGLAITFDSATLATAEQVGSDPVEGSEAVILAFTYDNDSPDTVELQAVPLTVYYGADLYDADSPTLYQDSGAVTELPKQITPGSTVKVVNTYWIPKGEPISVQVDVSGSSDMERPMATFNGIAVS